MQPTMTPQASLVLPFLICGFGLTWGAVFVFSYGFFLSSSFVASNPSDSLAGLCFLLGIVVSELAVYKNYHHIKGRVARLRLALIAVACVVIMAAGLVLSEYQAIPTPLIMVLAFLPGLWEGVFHTLWGEAFALSDTGHSTRNLYASVVVGALVFIFVTLTGTSLSIPLIALLLVVFSSICLWVSYSYLPSFKTKGSKDKMQKEVIPHTRIVENYSLQTKVDEGKEADGDAVLQSEVSPTTIAPLQNEARTRQLRTYVILFLVYGIVFGFGLSNLIVATSNFWSYFATGIALAGGVAVLLVLEVLRRRSIAFIDIARYILPLLAIELVPIPFVDENIRWLLCLLLIMTVTMFDTASFSFLANNAKLQGQSKIMVIARGRMFIQLGMLVGSAINIILVVIIDPLAQYSLYFPPVLLVLLFFTVAFIGSFEPLEMSTAQLKLPLPSVVNGSSPNPCEGCPLVPQSKNETRDILALRYRLSRRESDVLTYLIKGHTAPSIAATMQLSLSTVKTHIYHIYQKMEIGSRVELITIIETEETEHN